MDADANINQNTKKFNVELFVRSSTTPRPCAYNDDTEATRPRNRTYLYLLCPPRSLRPMLVALGSLSRSARASRAPLTTAIAVTTATTTTTSRAAALRAWEQSAQRPFSATSASSAASNTRWKARQGKDQYAREAKVRGLKSRAAFKLLEMDSKYRLFKPGQTVVDLVSSCTLLWQCSHWPYQRPLIVCRGMLQEAGHRSPWNAQNRPAACSAST
jgi:hypothetical protein